MTKKTKKKKKVDSRESTGLVVDYMDPCVCGHAPEEHGRDPEYPSSSACMECSCMIYEPDYEVYV